MNTRSKTINKVRILKLLTIAAIVVFAAASCEEVVDTTPPGKVAIIDVTPTNGGAIISYSCLSTNRTAMWSSACSSPSRG